MVKIWFILILIVMMLIGCTAAGGDEPEAAQPETDAATPGAVLVTVAATETELPTIAVNSDADVVVTSAAPAGSVDLSQITSEPPAEGGELIVQPMPGVPDALAALVNEASQDLARRLGIDVSEVTFIRSVAVDWNDGSLGCPQPGMGYLMAITPGYQLVLEAQGKEYYYHTRDTDFFVWCENAEPLEAGDVE
jgi:hypothetical protein